ncbi:MAG: HEPN domain-containing protein [Magnetococcales bacterium]|nr:HEPN domain-containing protein [Magnetococcales bacterium]
MKIASQMDYWRNGSDEDRETALILLEKGKSREGLFFMHLALEKILKAHFCKINREHPPRIHNLTLLARQSDLFLSQDQLTVLTDLNAFCLAGRYPDESMTRIDAQDAKNLYNLAQEVRTWLIQQL